MIQLNKNTNSYAQGGIKEFYSKGHAPQFPKLRLRSPWQTCISQMRRYYTCAGG